MVILGPTASGKSDVAMAVAEGLDSVAHVLAVDAMQVYRAMDIGTAKPTLDDQARVAHHGIDLVDPDQLFTVADYQRHALAALETVGPDPMLLVAGTGLYLTSVIDELVLPGQWPELRAQFEARDATSLAAELQQLDPVAAAKIEPGNHRRLARALEVCVGSGRPFSSFGPGTGAYPPIAIPQIGLRWQRDALAVRIERRVHLMMERGLLGEVQALLNRPAELSRTARQALGYKELIAALDGECSVDEAVHTTIVRTRQFAVRQERWFRRDPRIRWIEVREDPVTEVAPAVLELLQ